MNYESWVPPLAILVIGLGVNGVALWFSWLENRAPKMTADEAASWREHGHRMCEMRKQSDVEGIQMLYNSFQKEWGMPPKKFPDWRTHLKKPVL